MVGLYHGRVDPECLPIFQTHIHRPLDHQVIDGLSVFGVSRLKARLNASCLGTAGK